MNALESTVTTYAHTEVRAHTHARTKTINKLKLNYTDLVKTCYTLHCPGLFHCTGIIMGSTKFCIMNQRLYKLYLMQQSHLCSSLVKTGVVIYLQAQK